MTATPHDDADARATIRADLCTTLVVEAAAGTGKTSELVRRITAVLAEGIAEVGAIVAVTFTEKAAGELKLRLRSGLEQARHEADGTRRRHLEHALAHLEEARVGTIHAFCADLLRERPVEARLDPEFATMTEPMSARLHRDAFDRWLEATLADPPEGVRRSLRRRGSRDEGAATRLWKAALQLVEWRDFPAPWRREAFDREGAIASIGEQLLRFADRTSAPSKPRDNLATDTEPLRALAARVRVAGAVRGRDADDELEAEIVALARERDPMSPRKGYGTAYGPGVTRAEVLEIHAALAAAMTAFATAADADLAARLHDELASVTERYEAMKTRAGKLDFVDLLVRARDLLRDDDDVRASFQRRFRRIFVDEFQDTDPLQAEILLLLASADPAVRVWRDVAPEPGKLFVVGDPKQAIYRFRRADLAIYEEVKQIVVARGGKHVRLSTSFRSVPSIQRMVNAAFAPRMTHDPVSLQAAYVPLGHARSDAPGQPSIVALGVPDPYGVRNVTNGAVEASLPAAVGAFVHWLVTESGWTVTERSRPGERVPVEARHVCLLFRRLEGWNRADVTRPYVAALEARDVAHVLVGGRSFHEREEVATMTAALSAIEWPDDELSVFATLKGSLFALADVALRTHRVGQRRLEPLRVTREALSVELARVALALTLLRDLHRARNRRPVADTVSALLEATRAHAAFALRPSGPQALANVLHLSELGRQYEATDGLSFRGFVERLRDEANARSAAEAPTLEEGSDGVRLMTVHKAKGLEFPVVVLADITAKIATGSASRFVDPAQGLAAMRIGGWSPWELVDHAEGEVARDEAEGVRLAYVAATRARDLLVVPAVGDAPPFPAAGWLSPLHDAIFPAPAARRRAAPSPGCPSFGDDSVRARPDGRPAEGDNVHPGAHTFEGGYDVTWWDPSRLDLDRPPRFGVPRKELLAPSAPAAVVDLDRAAHAAWRGARDASIARASAPSLVVVTATARAALEPEGTHVEADEVALVAVPREANRPAGPRFGTLVHAVLAAVALDASEAVVADVTTLEGRILGATADEVAAAARAVTAALAHPLIVRAHEADLRGDCRRETPVLLALPGGTIVEGVVDLAFREAGAWTVVDFKTDRDITIERPIYERQVRLYAQAITGATGEPSSAVLLRV